MNSKLMSRTAVTYDTAKRVSKIQRYPTGKTNAENTCQQVNYFYDTNLAGQTFAQKLGGRLAGVQYYACVLVPSGMYPAITEMYSYHAAGAVTTKRVQIGRFWDVGGIPQYVTQYTDLNYTWNTAGQVASVMPPSAFSWALDRLRRDCPGAGLTKAQQRQVHDAITGQGYDKNDILDIMKGVIGCK